MLLAAILRRASRILASVCASGPGTFKRAGARSNSCASGWAARGLGDAVGGRRDDCRRHLLRPAIEEISISAMRSCHWHAKIDWSFLDRPKYSGSS